jgi:hypothetical protein
MPAVVAVPAVHLSLVVVEAQEVVVMVELELVEHQEQMERQILAAVVAAAAPAIQQQGMVVLAVPVL